MMNYDCFVFVWLPRINQSLRYRRFADICGVKYMGKRLQAEPKTLYNTN